MDKYPKLYGALLKTMSKKMEEAEIKLAKDKASKERNSSQKLDR